MKGFWRSQIPATGIEEGSGDLRMAEVGFGLRCQSQQNLQPPAAIQLTVKSILRRVQDLAGFVIKEA